jgi:hypothetical protein
MYADIGGPSTVLTAVVFGVVAWWSLVGANEEERPAAATPVQVTHPEAVPDDGEASNTAQHQPP